MPVRGSVLREDVTTRRVPRWQTATGTAGRTNGAQQTEPGLGLLRPDVVPLSASPQLSEEDSGLEGPLGWDNPFVLRPSKDRTDWAGLRFPGLPPLGEKSLSRGLARGLRSGILKPAHGAPRACPDAIGGSSRRNQDARSGSPSPRPEMGLGGEVGLPPLPLAIQRSSLVPPTHPLRGVHVR